ncbi:uncharacterized protein LOC135486100 isoform X2 [Lineus longissimus]|uniref:uncharacterized protein LOC135486100 isoform X2 n=1 Tax=Lineus longissimus TaxID=88925 RepID=UPI002B4E615C
METDDPEAEREPLKFDIKPDGLPPEMGDMLKKIKEVAEMMLYHWRSFPITLPPSVVQARQVAGDRELNDRLTFSDLFVAPNFDELEEVAMDANGEPKKLSEKQLEDVKTYGEFEVDSINFPGQIHKWRLTMLLQKGTDRSRDSLLHDTAKALRLSIITARNRFYSHFFSLSQSLRGILDSFYLLLDILLGMPSTTPGDIGTKIREEHTKHLIAEMDIKSNCKKEFSNFCEYVREKSKQLEAEKHKTIDLRPPLVPYNYQTPQGQEIDLRLFNNDLMKKSHNLLKEILEREAKGWYVQYKEQILQDLRGKNLSQDEISLQVNNAIMEEYLRRVYSAILSSEDVENLSPGLGLLLVQQAKAVLIMTKAAENVKIKIVKHKEELKTHLQKTYPVRSRIRAWVNEKLNEFEKEFISQNQFSVHEESIQKCREAGLEQSVYFLQRDLNFMKEREPFLRKELLKIRYPTREYYFHTRTWLPRNWVVKRHLHGESEVIPTVIVETPTAITAPRSGPNQPSPTGAGNYEPVLTNPNVLNDTVPTFSVHKHIDRKTTSRYPFWRWMNYMHRTWSWTWNAMFWLGLVIPWCSPVSLRALFFVEPFMPDLELSQVNGTLCPKPASKTHTLVSRLRSLWRHVRASRAHFESEPDTGFLGKHFTRHCNRIWNFVFKGAFGSFGLVLCFPLVCIVSSLLSMIAALTTPLWMPFITLLVHLAAVLFFDFDNPRLENNNIILIGEAIFWRFIFLGILQPIGALLGGLICCPIASVFMLFGGVLRYGFRRIWDVFMFHAVIKRLARIPSSDSFVARRVEGPGLASNFFYQIQSEQALAAVEAKMEQQELQAWGENVRKQIEKPVDAYRDFAEKGFKPFSAKLSQTGVFDRLMQETWTLTNELDQKIAKHRECLNLGLLPSVKTKVKLSTRDIKLTIAQAMKLVQDFYPTHVIARLPMGEEAFWEHKELEFRDWKGLTCQIFSEIFSPTFLTPLEEIDKTFRLEVQHLNLSRYVHMLKSLELRDDLDVINAIHTPKGELDIMSPFLEASVFDPRRHSQDYSEVIRRSKRKWPWKKPLPSHEDLQKLEVPPPVPHPVMITIFIYNRQNDQQQIRTDDSVIFTRIMRAAKKTPYTHHSSVGSASDDYTVDPDDIETSTPDHTTTSDPDIPASHLAIQERAFSDDNVRVNIESSDSRSDVVSETRRSSENRRRSSEGVSFAITGRPDNSCAIPIEQSPDDDAT